MNKEPEARFRSSALREGRVTPLTPRQEEVLALLAEGLGNKQIARMLHISRFTVRNHLTDIYVKLGTGNRVGAARVYLMSRGT